MAETNTATMPEYAEQPVQKTLDDYLTEPDAPTLYNLAPDIADNSGDAVFPSNIIEGKFEEKLAAAQDAEKKAVGQVKGPQATMLEAEKPETTTLKESQSDVSMPKVPQLEAATPENLQSEAATPESKKQEIEPPAKKGRGRPPKVEKTDKATEIDEIGKTPKAEKIEKAPEAKKPEKQEKAPDAETPEKQKRKERLPKGPKEEKQAAGTDGSVSGGGISGGNTDKEDAAPVAPESPPPPRDATRPGETETIVYLNHDELHPFKGHPFQVRNDDAMKALMESVKERGIDQPALVRPREGGGYELVAGHRRQHAAELAGYINVPCVIRNMTDDEAILAMTESNFNQRAEILPSERSKALKMQLDAIKRQGARLNGDATVDVGKRSNEIIAERNKMSIKNVQRYITLNNLIPELMKLVDEKKIKFTVAVDLSYVRPKNQRYIAVAMEAQESAPSGAQAQRMRELDQKNVLNGDVIDGIMLEEKKEDNRVILNSQELAKYFGPDKTPREMKDTIMKLLDEYKEKQPLELVKPTKTIEAAI
jgi:ParB/RepB/Spo0J family partition protein